MSVPLSVFEAAGYSDADAKRAKGKFDEQEVSLQHLANGDITQVRSLRCCRHPRHPQPALLVARSRQRVATTVVSGLSSSCSFVVQESEAPTGLPAPHDLLLTGCHCTAQDMLRDEFGIGQLGKRLKLLEAAKAANANAPKTKRRAAPADPVPEPKKEVALRQRKGKEPAKPIVAAEPKAKRLPDRRSMKQKIMDPKTVAEINELRSMSVQLSDWFSRNLGGARDVVAVGSILLSLGYWGATAVDALPPGWDLMP